MRYLRLFIVALISMCFSLVYISDSPAFNSAAHLYIAEKVYQVQNFDLYYGSIAPDLSLYVAHDKWPTSFEDTHYAYIDLRLQAIGNTQKAFAMGWITHNEKFGADYYAHRFNPLGNNTCSVEGYYQGYVMEKSCLLSSQTGIDPEFSHFIVETAIDLLLRNNDDKKLGEKLLNANLFRSFSDLNLLTKVFVLQKKRTDLLTLASAELTFRNLVNRYALALSLPNPYNKRAIAILGTQLALEMFDIEITEEEAQSILEVAISLCEGDYSDAVRLTINNIKKSLNN